MCSVRIPCAFICTASKRVLCVALPLPLFTPLLELWSLRLADSAVYAFPHWSLCLVLVGMVDTLALVLLFNARCTGLERRQIHGISIHQLLGDRDNVGD